MVFKVFLSSTSEIKRDVVKRFCSNLWRNQEIDIISISTKDTPLPLEGSEFILNPLPLEGSEFILNPLPEQPVNSGGQCVIIRNEFIKKYIHENLPEIEYDLLISIESSIDGNTSDEIDVSDVPHILIEDKFGEKYNAVGTFIPVPEEYFIKAKEISDKTKLSTSINGFSTTIGEVIAEGNPRVRKDNWMRKQEFGGMERTDQIYNGFKTILEKVRRRLCLKSAIIRVQDFPKQGVLFQDLSDILNDRVLLHYLKQEMLEVLSKNYLKVPRDKLKFIGLDARGFIYGSILASETNGSFVMARKAGKLPGKTVKVQYGTEYSKSEIEILPHLINKDDKIVIVDDLVATGGSLNAAKELVEKCGGTVMCCITVLEVSGLVEEARKKLYPIPIHVVL
jgi:adenine phosphoribosyltransferase